MPPTETEAHAADSRRISRSVELVIPCYNEAQRLRPDAFRAALDDLDDLSLLFFDDGSTDRTPQLLERLQGEAGTRVRVESAATNLGKAEAVRRGMQRALAGSAELVGYWDADLSAPLSEVPAMVRTLAAYSARAVIGSRVKALGRDVQRRASRHYLGRVFATAASLALDEPVYDTQCGAKIFVNDPRTRSLFDAPFDSTWAFDVELLARLREREGGLHPHVVEHVLSSWHHRDGSKVGYRDVLRVGRDLWRIRSRRK